MRALSGLFTKIDLGEAALSGLSESWPRHSDQGRQGARIQILEQRANPFFKAAIVHFEPGSHARPHRHRGHEFIFVIKGGFEDEFGLHKEKELVMYNAGSIHQWRSESGALLYVVWTDVTEEEGLAEGISRSAGVLGEEGRGLEQAMARHCLAAEVS